MTIEPTAGVGPLVDAGVAAAREEIGAAYTDKAADTKDLVPEHAEGAAGHSSGSTPQFAGRRTKRPPRPSTRKPEEPVAADSNQSGPRRYIPPRRERTRETVPGLEEARDAQTHTLRVTRAMAELSRFPDGQARIERASEYFKGKRRIHRGQIQFVIRRFAPFQEFGVPQWLARGQYEGDRRGFSSSVGDSARVVQTVNISLDGYDERPTSDQWSNPSVGHGPFPRAMMMLRGRPLDEMKDTATPGGETHRLPTPGNRARAVTAESHGANPLINKALSPDIDTQLVAWVEQDGDEIHVYGSLMGDPFPDAEVLLIDPGGTSVLLAGYHTPHGAGIGPMLHLPGKGQRVLAQFSTVIYAPDGSFSRVYNSKEDSPELPETFNSRLEGKGRED